MSDIEVRARDAAAMLENPIFNEALDVLEQEALDAFVATKSDQDAERTKCWVMVKQARRLRGYFEAIVDEGRFAANRAVREPLP